MKWPANILFWKTVRIKLPVTGDTNESPEYNVSFCANSIMAIELASLCRTESEIKAETVEQ